MTRKVEVSVRRESFSHPDRSLLAITGVFLFVNFFALSIIIPDELATHWVAFIVWGVAAIGGTAVLDRMLPDRDKWLFPLIMFSVGWGLVIIDRLFPGFAQRQIVWLALSVPVMLGSAVLPNLLYWLRNYRYLWLMGGLILLASTILFGRNPSGISSAPQLWLGVGQVNFQPSELLKIILVAFLASYLAEQYPALRAEGVVSRDKLLAFSPRVLGPVMLMWGLSIVMLIWQRDLGAATLFFLVFMILLYLASGNRVIVFGGLSLVVIAGILAYILIPLVRLRIDIWLNPWADAQGDAFQLVQSLQAFAAGGIVGQGVGQGSPYLVPVPHSDFVFAALAEEWGLLGVVTILVVMALIVMRGFQIALQQQQRMFHALLAVGFTSMIAVQGILIMGGVLGLLPLTGVPLPFLSYGGSSLLMSFVMVGLLLRLSDDTVIGI